jgi:hypothetical protein
MIVANKARTDRWKREDDAPRLKAEVPSLTSLRLELEEFAEGRPIPGTRRIRHIVVDQAAALFEIPCSDSKCEDGGHDVTRQTMNELEAKHQTFEFDTGCQGVVATRPCGRVLKTTAQAEYQGTEDE